MVFKNKKFKEHHPVGRAFGIIGAILLSGLGIFIFYSYQLKIVSDKQQLENRMKHVKHIAIDRIGKQTVYLVIMNGDTLGVVLAPE